MGDTNGRLTVDLGGSGACEAPEPPDDGYPPDPYDFLDQDPYDQFLRDSEATVNNDASRPAEDDVQAKYLKLVYSKVTSLRVERDARAIFAAENQAAEPFDCGTLAEILARPPEPAARVDRLMPWGGSTLVVAQRKTGKTTFVLNLARALVTGHRFLGELDVRPIATDATIGFLNFEVSGAQLARWAHDHGVPADRMFVVNVRGRRNPLAHRDDRAALAAALRAHNVEVLVVDPFGRAYSGASQNDAGEVGAWLVDLDTFARSEVGANDLILTTHAGWNGERTRGSSALEDWADSIVTLTKCEDTDERFVRALGRDVELDEDRMLFEVNTRTLRLAGEGSRREASAARHLNNLVEHVVRIVTLMPGANGTEVEDRLKVDGVPAQRGDGRKALGIAVERGQLTFETGSRGAKRYDLPRPTPTYPAGAPPTYPDPTYRSGVGQGAPEGSTYPEDQDPLTDPSERTAS